MRKNTEENPIYSSEENQEPKNNSTSVDIVSLLKENADSKIKIASREFFNGVGSVSTFLAMTPQGFFAFLLMDKILKSATNWSIAARLGLDTSMFINAEEGKRRLIRFYNKKDFENFVNFTYKNFLPKGATPAELFAYFQKIFSYSLTTNISILFAGLTFIACAQSGKFLEDYNSEFTNVLKNIVTHIATKSVFGFSSFLSNMVANPTINFLAWSMMTGCADYLITNPAYRKESENLSQRLENSIHDLLQEQKQVIYKTSKQNKSTRLDSMLTELNKAGLNITTSLKQVIENKNVSEQDKRKLATCLKNAVENNQAPDKLESYEEKLACVIVASIAEPKCFRESLLLANTRDPQKRGQIDIWLDFLLQHAMAAGLTGVSILGLVNFLGMTDQSWQEFHNDFDLPPLNKGLRYITMISMSNLALISVYPSIQNFMTKMVYPLFKYAASLLTCNYKSLSDCGFASNSEVSLISKRQYAWILLTTLIICGFGGFPNVYQSLLDNERTYEMISAEFASFFIEVPGFLAYSMMIYESDIVSVENMATGIWRFFQLIYQCAKWLNPIHYFNLLLNYFTKPTLHQDKKEAAQLFSVLKNAAGPFGALNAGAVAGDISSLHSVFSQGSPTPLQDTQDEFVNIETVSNGQTQASPPLPGRYYSFIENITNSSFAKSACNFWNNFSLVGMCSRNESSSNETTPSERTPLLSQH